MDKSFTLEAQDNTGFQFTFHIEKAVAEEAEDGGMVLAGVASTTNIDHDNERMAANSLKSMAHIINTQGVPLRYEHQKSDNAIIGWVNKAELDERNQLKIVSTLNKEHPAAPLLYKALKEQGAKYGFSVGGRVKRAVKEFSEQTGKMVKTFYDVLLDEVSVTQRPANYDAWLVAKSIVNKGDDTKEFYKSSLYQEFLFENPQLDYMRAFAKSVPDKSWKKINSNEESTTMKTKKAADEKDEETTKGYVTNKSFSEFQALVSKGFNSLTAALSKMTTDAKDTTNPDKDKEENIGDMEKAADGTDEEGTRESKKAMDSEEETKEKSADDEKDETKEKSADDEKDETKEKAMDDKDEDETKTSKSMQESISRIEALTKNMKFTKSEDGAAEEAAANDEEEAKEEAEVAKSVKGGASIDKFVAVVANALETMKENFEKSNKTVVGFERMFVDAIRNDTEIQKELANMMKEPGFKKSVVMNTPIMRTKDGRTYELTAKAIGTTIEKSQKEGQGDFKSQWKSNFSSEQNQG